MARQPGSANFSGTIEALAGGPLDARSIVKTKADLTAVGSFEYPYIGMETYVVSENKKYRLIGDNPLVVANWEEIDVFDTELDTTSENGVQNKVITEALEGKADLVGGKVPASQLPSFVDDVVDGYYKEADGKFYADAEYQTEIVGEAGKIYISVDTEIQYRWTGDAFSPLGGALTLGETSSTAYRGDRGKIAYDDSQTNKSHIGTLSNLLTTAKNNLVAAINELFNSKQNVLSEGDGIVIENDEISVDEMSSADMAEIVTPLPSVMSRRMKYSTEEQVVGEWINGKPLYQKTIQTTLPSGTTIGTMTMKNVPIGASIDFGYVVESLISSGGSNFSMLYMDNDKNGVTKATINNNHNSQNPNCVVLYASRWFDTTCYITIRYTKV